MKAGLDGPARSRSPFDLLLHPSIMKKVALLILAGLLSTPAFAQNSVTLYGIVDNGITYVSNAGGKALW